MWLKLCLLLVYIFLLFILSRILETISWCESSYSAILSRQLLDPMVLSVARLKALLEQRGISYEGVVEKSELTSLVEASGPVSVEEAEMCEEEDEVSSDTNFTAGAHFIEQVEDAKDSVWLVQVLSHRGQHRAMSDSRWKTVRHKASKFGVRTGLLDCSLDKRYCEHKGWHSPFLLLALPSQFEKKANVAMYNYSGPVKETAVLRWMRDRLDERVIRIKNPVMFQQQWENFTDSPLDPEIRAVLFTESSSAPLFYSALSVKFPGRVKFGLISLESADTKNKIWHPLLEKEKISQLPAYVIYTTERNYTYGMRPGEHYSFPSMELFLRYLYPCLNDIFIISFCLANVTSWFEFIICNCGLLRRIRKLVWCIIKYNIVVIMLWLPIIAVFQMPYLDRVPLLALKMERLFSTSYFGTMLRGDISFYINHPLYVFLTFGFYLAVTYALCKKYRQIEQDDDDWFNFSQMGTFTHLRPNNLFEPMRGLDIFGSHLSRPSLWLQPSVSPDYIKHLPTWRYCPVPLAARAAANVEKVAEALGNMPASCSHDSTSPSACSDPHRSKTCPVSNSNCKKCGKEMPSSSSSQFAQQDTEFQTALDSSSVGIQSQSSQSVSKNQNMSTPAQSYSPAHQPINQVTSSLGRVTDHPAQNSQSCFPNDQWSSQSLTSSSSSQVNVSERTEVSRADSSCYTVPDHSSTTSTSTSGPAHPLETRLPMNAETSGKPQQPASPVRKNGFPEGYLESHQCVICLDEYVPLTVLCGLPCGHVFHETCIISWLNREKHFCPMCRWPSYKLHNASAQSSY